MPWLGFFSKLACADAYVALDNTHLRKRHYHDRAAIVGPQGDPLWLSIPTGDHIGRPLNEVFSSDETVFNRFRKTIEFSYKRSSMFVAEWETIDGILQAIDVNQSIADINIGLIEKLYSILLSGQTLTVVRASETVDADNPTDRIIALCRSLGANELLVGDGASLDRQVHDVSAIEASGIAVWRQRFSANEWPYPQTRRQRAGFMPGLSIVDALLNIGRSAVTELIASDGLKPTRLF